VPYFSLFPEKAVMGTRKINLLQDTFGLKRGEYCLFESYCVSKNCDCRKVMINVMDLRQNKILGTVGFGWENPEFYIDWLFGDKELGEQMSGVYIEMGGIQNNMQKECLETVFNSLRDTHYVNHIKDRYIAIKDLIEKL
jgi:hypothetical protein